MRPRIVLTDLDGTLLEADGSACAEAKSALALLRELAIPVCAVTSKTAGEVGAILRELGVTSPAAVENGAGVLLADGRGEPRPEAVPVATLMAEAERLRAATGAPLRTLLELSDAELGALTGLSGTALAAARDRRATLPLVVDPRWDGAIRAALAAYPPMSVLRGNRFLHLQGRHDKASAVPRLLELAHPGPGVTVALGDSPNDAGLLEAADVAVIVPGVAGPHPELVRRFPAARVAALPHGRGWAAAVRGLLAADRDGGA